MILKLQDGPALTSRCQVFEFLRQNLCLEGAIADLSEYVRGKSSYEATPSLDRSSASMGRAARQQMSDVRRELRFIGKAREHKVEI